MWSRTGHEIFFNDLEQRIRVVSYTTDAAGFHPGTPRVWSEIRIMNLTNIYTLDLAPDGKRLAIIPAGAPGEADRSVSTLMFLFNLPGELQRLSRDAK